MRARSRVAVAVYALAALALATTVALLFQLLRSFEHDLEANLRTLQRVFSNEQVLKTPGDPAVRFASVEELASKYENRVVGGQGYFDAITVTKVFGEEERVVYPFYLPAFLPPDGSLVRGAPAPHVAAGGMFMGRPVPGADDARLRVLPLELRPGMLVGKLYVLLNQSGLRRVRLAIGMLASLLAGTLLLLALQFRRQEAVISRTTVELEEKRRELMRLERLALAGQLSAGVLHDLRKPVLNIRNELRERADAQADPPETDRRLLDQADTFFAILRDSSLERLVRAEGEKEFVDLNEVLERSLSLVRYERGGVEVRTQLDRSLPPLLAVPVRLVQVFSNLVLNAFQAMEGKGRLSVRSGREAGWIFAEIEDTGPGIPAGEIDKVFLPFFTTKPGESGTGLGLYITRDIVTQAGGTVAVDSAPGRTVFRVSFPEPS
jgi:signal transduction histidine kinase